MKSAGSSGIITGASTLLFGHEKVEKGFGHEKVVDGRRELDWVVVLFVFPTLAVREEPVQKVGGTGQRALQLDGSHQLDGTISASLQSGVYTHILTSVEQLSKNATVDIVEALKVPLHAEGRLAAVVVDEAHVVTEWEEMKNYEVVAVIRKRCRGLRERNTA